MGSEDTGIGIVYTGGVTVHQSIGAVVNVMTQYYR